MRSILTFGHIAWCSAPDKFYQRLEIMERHAVRLAHRLRLPYPNVDLYTRMDFPRLTQHIATLRRSFLEKRLTINHEVLLDTIFIDRQQDAHHKYCYNPLNILLSLYTRPLAPDHYHKTFFRSHIINDHNSHIFPS